MARTVPARASPRGPGRPPGAFSLDRFPEVYDAAFGWDRHREANTFLRVATDLLGRPPRSVAELACGTGRLARIWSAEGHPVVGVDRNPTALRRARHLSEGLAPAPVWLRSRLERFRLPHRVDLAVLPLDGLTYLAGRPALEGFFRSAARSLGPRGVLLLDVSTFPPQITPPPFRHRWTVRLRPGGYVRVEWRSWGRVHGSPRSRVEVADLRVRSDDGTVQTFWEAAPHAVLSTEEIGECARSSGNLRTMTVYDGPAHRGVARLPRPLRTSPRKVGEHLLALSE